MQADPRRVPADRDRRRHRLRHGRERRAGHPLRHLRLPAEALRHGPGDGRGRPRARRGARAHRAGQLPRAARRRGRPRARRRRRSSTRCGAARSCAAGSRAAARRRAARPARRGRDRASTHKIEFLEVLAETIEAKDRYMRGHARRVAFYAGLIAERMQLPPETQERVRLAAFLHDLGKVGVPTDLLLRCGRARARRARGRRAPPGDRRAPAARRSACPARSRRRSAITTSGGTAPATRTASPARRSRSTRASSRSRTPSTR